MQARRPRCLGSPSKETAHRRAPVGETGLFLERWAEDSVRRGLDTRLERDLRWLGDGEPIQRLRKLIPKGVPVLPDELKRATAIAKRRTERGLRANGGRAGQSGDAIRDRCRRDAVARLISARIGLQLR